MRSAKAVGPTRPQSAAEADDVIGPGAVIREPILGLPEQTRQPSERIRRRRRRTSPDRRAPEVASRSKCRCWGRSRGYNSRRRTSPRCSRRRRRSSGGRRASRGARRRPMPGAACPPLLETDVPVRAGVAALDIGPIRVRELRAEEPVATERAGELNIAAELRGGQPAPASLRQLRRRRRCRSVCPSGATATSASSSLYRP